MRSIFQLIKRAFHREAPIHPVEARMAKQWIKRRLVAVFPELRNNPAALERAYKALSLEVRPGAEEGEEGAVFQVNFAGELPEE